MKIVHVDDNFMPTIGFQTNFLAKYGVSHGHEVTIVASDSIEYWTNSGFFPKDTADRLGELDEEFRQKYGARIIRLKSHGKFLNRELLSPSVFSIVKNLKPDVVLVHYCDTFTGMRFATKASRLPYPILSDCHMVEQAAEQKPLFRRLFHSFYQRFITPYFIKNEIPVIATALDVRKYCMQHYGLPEALLPVMSLAADTMLFQPDPAARQRFRQSHGIGPDDFVCIYTGKNQPSKKVHLLAEAFQKKLDGQRKAVLLMVGSGSGEYSDRVNAVLSASENKVLNFPTQDVENLAAFYQAADVAIWPGACSLSFYDAQACALPVIVERIPANEERIRQEIGNGSIYEPDDLAGLRSLIEAYYQMDPGALAAMGQRGREVILQNYNYDKVALDVENLMSAKIKKWAGKHAHK